MVVEGQTILLATLYDFQGCKALPMRLHRGAVVGEYASSRTGNSPAAGRSEAAFPRGGKKRVTEFRHLQAIDMNNEYATLEKIFFGITGANDGAEWAAGACPR